MSFTLRSPYIIMSFVQGHLKGETASPEDSLGPVRAVQRDWKESNTQVLDSFAISLHSPNNRQLYLLFGANQGTGSGLSAALLQSHQPD